MKNFILSALCLGTAVAAHAQSLNKYNPAGHISVEKGAHALSAPFCGGFNTPQFSIVDLNGDGKGDLVSFEGYGKSGVRTFINHGFAGAPDYRYAPQFEAAFPEIVNYMLLMDYNRDGVPDLFHAGLAGFNVSKGYYDNGKLRFQFVKELYYGGPSGQEFNAYVGNSAIPGIVDVDGDGDLDFFSYSINGSRILYYQNLQEEYGLPRDTIRLHVVTGCWGGTMQLTERPVLMGYNQNTCDTNYIAFPPAPGADQMAPHTKAKGTMHGTNTLCAFDMDGDGDIDYLNGNGAFNDIQFVKNGRVEYNWSRDTMVAQDTLWQSSGRQYYESNYPAAFYADYNGDGLKDIIIAPHGAGSRNRAQIWYYQNNGTAAAPRFDFTTDSLFSNDIIDVGRYARPLFYDYNKDGKLDLLVGGLEKLPTGAEVPRLHYYENITTAAGAPKFRYVTDNLAGVSNLTVYATDPAVGDVDGDGKDDLIIGRTDGKVVYFQNTAASASVQPVWTLTDIAMARNGSNLIDVWSYASPVFYDINKDGKPDLVLGQADGTLTAFLNTNTTPGIISYGPAIDTFGGVRVSDNSPFPYPFRRSRPFLGKLQAGSAKDYLVMGNYYGTLGVWEDVESGNPAQSFVPVADTFSQIVTQEYTAPAVADVDGDGKLEMVLGTETGGLLLYWTGASLGVETSLAATSSAVVSIYPNPAHDAFQVSVSGNAGQSGIAVTVTDLSGRVLFRENWPAGKDNGVIAVRDWPVGTYLFSLQSEAGVETRKIQVLR